MIFAFFVPKVLRIIFFSLLTPLPSLKTQNWTKYKFILEHPVQFEFAHIQEDLAIDLGRVAKFSHFSIAKIHFFYIPA